MIAFFDTSALVKFYIAEQQSDAIVECVAAAEAVVLSRITWAEFHAAVARRAREVPGDQNALEAAKDGLAADWSQFVVMDVTQQIVAKAGEFADIFALRAYDAVQIATANEAAQESRREVNFACFDKRLTRAANLLGMSGPNQAHP